MNTIKSINYVQNIVGTFTDGETITGTSSTRDVDITFTVSSQITTSGVTNDGILNSVSDTLSIESLGSGVSEVVVEDILTGSVSDVIVDDGGSLYEVGDTVSFTSDSNDTDINVATGVVSMVGGGIQLETGTLDDPDIITDSLLRLPISIISGEISAIMICHKFLSDGRNFYTRISEIKFGIFFTFIVLPVEPYFGTKCEISLKMAEISAI